MANGSGGSPVGTRFTGFVPTVTIGRPALPGQSGAVIALRSPVLLHGTPTPPLVPLTGAAERNIRISDFVADAIRGGSERPIGRHLVARFTTGHDEDAPARSAGGASGRPQRVVHPTMAMEAVALKAEWAPAKAQWVHAVLHHLKPWIEGAETERLGEDSQIAKGLGDWYDRLGARSALAIQQQLDAGNPAALQRCWAVMTIDAVPSAVHETQLAMTAIGDHTLEVDRAVATQDVGEALRRDQAAIAFWFETHVFPVLREVGFDISNDAAPEKIVEALFTVIKSYYFIGDQLKAIFAQESEDEQFGTGEVLSMLFSGLQAIADDDYRVPGQRGYQHLMSQRLATTAAEHVSHLKEDNPFGVLANRYAALMTALREPSLPVSMQLALRVSFGVTVAAAQWNVFTTELQATPLYALASPEDSRTEAEELQTLRNIMGQVAGQKGYRRGTQFGVRATNDVPPAWKDAATAVDALLQDHATAVSVIQWVRRWESLLFGDKNDAPQFPAGTQAPAAARELLWKGGMRLLTQLRRYQLLIDVLAGVYEGGMSNRAALKAALEKLLTLHAHPPVGLSFQDWGFYRGLIEMILAEVRASRPVPVNIQLAVDYQQLVNALADSHTPPAVRQFVMAGLLMPTSDWANVEGALKSDALFLAGEIQEILTELQRVHSDAHNANAASEDLFLQLWDRLQSLLTEWRRLSNSSQRRAQRNGWALYIIFNDNPEHLESARRHQYRALLSS